MSSNSAGSMRSSEGIIHTPEGIILEPVNMTNVKDGFNHAQFGVIGSGLRTRASQPLPSSNAQRVHATKPMSEPDLRAPYSGHGGSPASAHANQYDHLEHVSRGMVRHLGLRCPVTNGENYRGRTFAPAEEQLAPALEKFGVSGPCHNRLAHPHGSGLLNELEWSDSTSNGSDGTGNSTRPMTPTASNTSSGGTKSTKMSLQAFMHSTPSYLHSFHDIQASQIDPYMAGNRTGFSAHDRFDGFQGPHLNNNFASSLLESNGHGYSGTNSYEYYSYIQTLQQNEALKQQVVALRGYLAEKDERFKYACAVAIKHLNTREGDLEGLKRQLREAGHHPCIEPVVSVQDKRWDEQFGMLFRNLSCWAKKHYKFPTGETVPANIHARLLQICHDPRTVSNLMRSAHTKYMVIVSLATRWLVDEIFTPHFLAGVVHNFAKSDSEGKPSDGFREAMATAKENPGYSLRMYEAIQSAANKRGDVFLKSIHSLSSRPTDDEHIEKSFKTFTDVVHQASRMVFDAKKADTSFFFHFPSFGDPFITESMKEAIGDTLGLTVAENNRRNPVWHELCGAQVRLCMLPRTRISFKEPGNKLRYHEAYKATVLVIASGY